MSVTMKQVGIAVVGVTVLGLLGFDACISYRSKNLLHDLKDKIEDRGTPKERPILITGGSVSVFFNDQDSDTPDYPEDQTAPNDWIAAGAKIKTIIVHYESKNEAESGVYTFEPEDDPQANKFTLAKVTVICKNKKETKTQEIKITDNEEPQFKGVRLTMDKGEFERRTPKGNKCLKRRFTRKFSIKEITLEFTGEKKVTCKKDGSTTACLSSFKDGATVEFEMKNRGE